MYIFLKTYNSRPDYIHIFSKKFADMAADDYIPPPPPLFPSPEPGISDSACVAILARAQKALRSIHRGRDRSKIRHVGCAANTSLSCDICGIDEKAAGGGGAVVCEEDGSRTQICRECFSSYCRISPVERKSKYGCKWAGRLPPELPEECVPGDPHARTDQVRERRRERSFWFGIGTDPWALARAQVFADELPFEHQILAYRAVRTAVSADGCDRRYVALWRYLDLVGAGAGVIPGVETREQLMEATMFRRKSDGERMIRSVALPGAAAADVCWNPECSRVFPAQDGDCKMVRCSRCLVAAYCSAECQRADEKRHLAACTFASIMLGMVKERDRIRDAESADAAIEKYEGIVAARNNVNEGIADAASAENLQIERKKKKKKKKKNKIPRKTPEEWVDVLYQIACGGGDAT